MTKRNVLILVASLALSLAFYGLEINNRFYSLEELYLRIENSDDYDEIKGCLYELTRRGKDGIPILNRTLTKYANNLNDSGNYWMTGVILLRLYDLAEKKIYIPEEVPVLIDLINKQKFISDTLITADILKKITGIDVGYNEKFIKQYTEKDEFKRQKMISRWKEWYDQRGQPEAG